MLWHLSLATGTLYVALELIPHGNLRTYLRQIRREDVSGTRSGVASSQLLQFAHDVANGMRHLADIGVRVTLELFNLKKQIPTKITNFVP